MERSDYLVRATAHDGLIRAFAIDATDVVNELVRRHDTWPVVTAALGRLSIGALLFGAMLKEETHMVTIRVQGDGPAGTLLASANATGGVRGLVSNPQPEVEPVRNGKLNVRGAVGTSGYLTVTRDLGLGQPYVGTVEIVSGADFYAHAATSPVSGPGWEALQEARRTGRPAVLLTAHYGNAAAVGAALKARGFVIGTFFKPMPDPAVNRFYTAAVEAVTSPLFPSGREGVAGMIRHLRGGGMLSISFDLDRPNGVMLEFLGKPARTVLSMAEMALKYDALLVPVYGIRRDDGLHFDVFIDAPIPHGDPAAMTQAVNDSLGRMVTLHKDQWLWWHRRWKDDHPADAAPPAGPEG